VRRRCGDARRYGRDVLAWQKGTDDDNHHDDDTGLLKLWLPTLEREWARRPQTRRRAAWGRATAPRRGRRDRAARGPQRGAAIGGGELTSMSPTARLEHRIGADARAGVGEPELHLATIDGRASRQASLLHETAVAMTSLPA
jgi:hypothetical protein